VLLTDSRVRHVLEQSGSGVEVIDLQADEERWAWHSGVNLAVQETGLCSSHLCYVIYTSGSTGEPKGVMIEHRNTVNLLWWARSAMPAEVFGQTLQSTSLNFDLSVYECFVPLTTGGQIRVVETALALLKPGIEVTLINTVPSAIQGVLNGGALPQTTRVVNLAGEELKEAVVKEIFTRSSVERVCNLYGPSETTTYSSWISMSREQGFVASIGRPIANTQIYLLDGHGQPAPIGVVGEIYIGGAGVARGYLNRPELTAERFVKDPFQADPRARMYRSGDLGRWRAEGTIEYLGRNDHQVKIRGYRIELGEIEAQLRTHARVREAVVLAREDVPGQRRLVAYLTPTGEAPPIEALRELLKGSLPEYMLPSAFVVLESLPLTPNGKLDRKALPAPAGDFGQHGYEAPQGEVESTLAQLWQELLRVERVGRHDNFFELGGHSLLAVQVITRIRQVLGRELSVRVLFESPTVQRLARQLGSAHRAEVRPIIRADRTEALPLSWAQQRLWFIDQLEGGGTAYHLAAAVRLHGALDLEALQSALDTMLERHEVLRTVFRNADGQPVQVITEMKRFALQVVDLSHQEQEERNAAVLQQIEEAQTAFDLGVGPLIRGRLVRLSSQEHVLVVTMHHIISDAWSSGVLIQEVSVLYAAYREGRADPLPPLPIQYADYALWQRQWLEGEVLERQLQYWKQQMSGAPALLELPTDRPRPPTRSHLGGSVPLELGPELSRRIGGLARRHDATLFMTLYAGLAILLSRLSGQQDIVIGASIANRQREEIEGLIGFFANTLPLRIQLTADASVGSVIQQVREMTLEAYSYQDVPFEQIVEALQPSRTLSHSPVFQVMLVLQNTPRTGLSLPGLRLTPEVLPQRVGRFDLTLSVQEGAEEIQGSLSYASDLFDPETIERWAQYLKSLLEEMTEDAQRQVSSLALLDTGERQRVLEEFNTTVAAYPREKLLHELIEEQVERTPQAIAVICGEEQLTYEQLNRRANQLAHYLVKRGVGADQLVGLCLAPSLELIIGMLAVLKAGGAYVPLEPSHPAERLGYMLEDCAASWVLTQERIEPLLPAGSAQTVVLDRDWEVIEPEELGNPVCRNRGAAAEHLAYVMYTSGSTGQPKGVMVEHRNLVNYTYQAVQRFEVALGSGSLIGTSLGFDLALTGLYPPLVCGKPVRLFADTQDLQGLSTALLSSRDLAPVKLTPSHLTALLSLLPPQQLPGCVRVLVLGGEALTAEGVHRWWQADSGTRIFNHYGPTETTIGCVMHELDRRERGSVPIGRPIANARIYILDEQREPVPIGAVGEIYIGGAGVARGYLNRPELTAERFVKDPFQVDAQARMYRSGDLGRWRADGTIEYLGRNDSQVKIRGYRIELGEIEAQLLKHPQVLEATTLEDFVPGEQQSPGKMLDVINRRLTRTYTGGAGTFVTAFYGVFDPADRSFRYASAGHHPPRLKRCADGAVSVLNGVRGLPLGIEDDFVYSEQSARLSAGDILLLYTDGITEAWSPSGEMFGSARLDEILSRCLMDAEATVREVIGEIQAFTGGVPPTDDRTLLAALVD